MIDRFQALRSALVLVVLLGTANAAERELIPPRLIQFVSASLPPSDDAEVPEQGTVTARLSIDENGKVVDVAVEDATHPYFVAPAVEAMRRFVFSPAKDGEIPIESTAIYRYRFEARTKADAKTATSHEQPNVEVAVEGISASSTNEEASAAELSEAPYESVVRGSRIYEGIAEYRLEAEEIKRIPGIHGDPVLAVQTMPGTAKPPAMLGALFIRGSSDADSLSLVDSLPVPTVFHFGSINTVVNGDLIDSVLFIPGNFSARYGRGTGGVVDLLTRPPRSDRLHAYIDADLWDATAFIEGPVGKKGSLCASFRRSYIDGVLKATGLLEDQLQFTAAPRYYDFQLKGHFKTGKRSDISILLFGSDDKVAFGEGVLADSGYLTREIFTRSWFYAAGFTWRYRLHRGLTHELSFRGGYSFLNGEGSMETTQSKALTLDFREEILVDLSPTLRLRVGTDSGAAHHALFAREKFGDGQFEEQKWEIHPSSYLELFFLAIPKTELVYGFRMDYDGLNGNWSVDPRFEATYTPLKGTVLKAGFGLFHQPPGMYRAFDDDVVLKPMSAIHYGLKVEQEIPHYERLKLELGGFYKDLRRTNFDARDTGRALGLEVLIRHRPNRYFFGWIAYTLMKSERFQGGDKDHAVPFQFDQTHVLSLVAGVSLPHQVGLGLRFRLASGFPYTPIEGTELYDDWFATEVPIWGENNSGRMPLFHQLDLRADKTFVWKYLKLSVYIDVQNVYNRQNAVVYLYSSDYSTRKTVYDLPVLPSLGLRLEY